LTTPVERISALTIGTVESVSPSEIRVIIDVDAPHTIALNTGVPTPFPRINSYILIPNESGAVVGLITWLGVERSAFPKRVGLKDYGLIDLPFPLRKMSLTPVGTLVAGRQGRQSSYQLIRGVSVFPSVGDLALLPTPEQVSSIVAGERDDRRVPIGTSPLAGNAVISVDPDKLFGRHLAVLGNTGSGKSCTVAGLIRWSLDAAREQRRQGGKKDESPNARFIVLDPNGEYLDAFRDLDPPPRVFRVPPVADGISPLAVPAWMWDSREWTAFASAAPGTQRPLLLQALRDLRAGHAVAEPAVNNLRRLMISYKRTIQGRIAQGVSGYTGFPANKDTGEMLRNMAEDATTYLGKVDATLQPPLNALAETATRVAQARFWKSANSQGYNDFSETAIQEALSAIEALLGQLPPHDDVLGPTEDAPVPFEVKELPDHLEHIASQGATGAQVAQFIATLVMRIRMMLSDRRLGPLVSDSNRPLADWLQDYIGSNDAANGHLAIIDLSLVPSDVLHVVIAVIARVVFEATQRYMKLNSRELPCVLVLEEAHTFVQRGSTEEDHLPSPLQMCRHTFERIAREGRKFGLGLVLSSQRPSELSPTALAQCNSFLLHRIVNDRDQELVHRLVPDTLAGLLNELPSLPARQAILLGWATPVPVLVEISELPEPHRPRSPDPHFWEVWTGASDRPIDWDELAKDWIS
jgi:DNA helicase HerA-like ATPase